MHVTIKEKTYDFRFSAKIKPSSIEGQQLIIVTFTGNDDEIPFEELIGNSTFLSHMTTAAYTKKPNNWLYVNPQPFYTLDHPSKSMIFEIRPQKTRKISDRIYLI